MTQYPEEQLRRTVYYTGMVQGVGFRYTTERTARDFDVTGFVRNLPDGRVELVAEGTPAEVDRFTRTVTEALRRYISDTVIGDAHASGEFSSFSIAF